MKGFIKFFGNKKEKKMQAELIEEKLSQMRRDLKEIKFIDISYFKSDMEIFLSQHEVLKMILSISPNMVNNPIYKKTYNAVSSVVEKCDEINSKAVKLAQEEKILTKEILQYSKTAKELGQKYKLSPDWEGNKPKMAQYGKMLNSKRDDYIKKEEALTEYLRSFYENAKTNSDIFWRNISKIL